MTEVVSERGFAAATVERVLVRSGCSRHTFYELFGDREECFLVACEEAVARASSRVHEAQRSGDTWRERIRTSLMALLSFFEDEPLVGRMLVVETLAAGSRALERRARVLGEIAAVVDEGRAQARGGALTPLTAEGVVGAVFSIIHGRVTAGEPALLELTNQLMSVIVQPYLGVRAAREELDRALPERAPAPLRADPLVRLGMRMTYRTMRVLLAIGNHPDASNREVGRAAGLEDQGQISKLLARLQRLGLIENTSDRRLSITNAWRLSPDGESVLRVVGQSRQT